MVPVRVPGAVALPALLVLALGGCVDALTSRAPADAARWSGTTSVGKTADPECGAFAFDARIYPDPYGGPEIVTGRARPTRVPEGRWERLTGRLSSWWFEGTAAVNDVVSLDLRLQEPFRNVRPYSTWRGTRQGERITLVEADSSPCRRELVLTKQ